MIQANLTDRRTPCRSTQCILHLIACLAALTGVPATQAQESDPDLMRLRYMVTTLGNAEAVRVVSPGMDGSGHAAALDYTVGSWARFNWPRFEPVSTVNAVHVGVRSEGERPEAVFVRVLAEDGIEWQTETFGVGPQWRRIQLQAADFQYFRGATEESAGTLDLGRAVQFQILPSTQEGTGSATFQVDTIRFLPDGPQWTMEDDELREPLDALEAERLRLDDILRRWSVEVSRLEAETVQTRRWLTELTDVMDRWTQPEQREAITQALTERRFAWQQPGQAPPDMQNKPLLDKETFRTMLQGVDDDPVPLLDPGEEFELALARLYSAGEQPLPAVALEDGRRIIRHAITFDERPVRQTVFTVLNLPRTMDLEGQRLVLDMRFEAGQLNEEFPLVLRVFTGDGALEAWADFRPSPMPADDWQEVSFDLMNPLRSVRYDAGKAYRLGFRVENRIGSGGEVLLALRDIRRAPPTAVAQIGRRMLRQIDGNLDTSRETLYRLRQQIAIQEDHMRSVPALRRAYIASIQRLPDATPAQTASAPQAVLAEITLPASDKGASLFHTRTELDGVTPALRIQADRMPEGTVLAAELRDASGTLVAAGIEQASAITLSCPGAAWWEPGRPVLYDLKTAVLDTTRVVACLRQPVGFQRAAVHAGAVDPLLRGVRQRRQPDWTFLLNGEATFLRMTRYTWPDQADSLRDGVRMLGDLWVDGLRDYGFANNPDRRERCRESGIAKLSSYAPSYSSLGGWDDVLPWQDAYRRQYRQLRPVINSPETVVTQVGNEAELHVWGADLASAFPDTPYQPIDMAAQQIRQHAAPASPVMYVRAASLRTVPPLPHETVCGINQYTGRYSGRMDWIERDLAELAREAAWADRPLMITEWMGPKYSWAGGGVGGVTRRGAAYYLERYWRAMTTTPGVVGSAEFTLNWVIAPFEDLTTQTREQAYANRPPHSAFGGGSTADHVPLVRPEDAVRGPCFESMQGFHGPLYTMIHAPGPIHIAGAGADGIAAHLATWRDQVSASSDAATMAEATDGHLVRLMPVSSDPAAPQWDEPRIHTRLNPRNPDYLITTLSAPSEEARQRGVDRLIQSAQALEQFNALEGAMPRAVALVDPGREAPYSNYLLEFAARGLLATGDDIRTRLSKDEFYAENGTRRPAWNDLEAVILDCARPLEEEEMALINGWLAEGLNVVVSAPCYLKNRGMGGLLEAKLTVCGSLYDHYPVVNALREPLPVRDLGGADRPVVREFRPDLAKSQALLVHQIDAPGTQPLALNLAGQPVIVKRDVHDGQLILVGSSIGDAVTVHQRVTRSGRTHRLYDRDTACGLERLSRVVVNLCRLDKPPRQHRPRLFITVSPETTVVQQGNPVRATLKLTDVQGNPYPGQVRIRSRVRVNGWPHPSTPYLDRFTDEQGVLEIACAAAAGDEPGTLTYQLPEDLDRPAVISLQIKAWANGTIPTNAALAVVAVPKNR